MGIEISTQSSCNHSARGSISDSWMLLKYWFCDALSFLLKGNLVLWQNRTKVWGKVWKPYLENQSVWVICFIFQKRDILIFITVTCSKFSSFPCVSTTSSLESPNVSSLETQTRTNMEIYLQKFHYLSLTFVHA